MRAVTLPLASGEVRLSVVIASYNSIETIARCLRSLETQDARQAYEVIVVDSSTDGTADLVRREFPSVRLFVCSERKFPGDARNIGVSRALGDLIAFTDADCFVDASWVSRVVDAHDRTDHGVIGGAVENGNPGSYVGWAHYFSEFSSWMPHVAPGEMLEIPTTCLTMKRWVFEKYGPFLERTFSSDSAFGWTVSKHGCHPLFLPTIRVSHINITSLTVLLGHRVRRGACFARVRVAEQRFSWLRRIAYVPLTPVLPAILFGRVLRLVVNDGFHLSRFVGTCPLVFLGFVAWSWGELLGYLSTPQPDATS